MCLSASTRSIPAVPLSRRHSTPAARSVTKGIYLISKGKVEISKITLDGWKQTLAVLVEHHFLGELSVIEGRQWHSVDATAIEDTEFFLLK